MGSAFCHEHLHGVFSKRNLLPDFAIIERNPPIPLPLSRATCKRRSAWRARPTVAALKYFGLFFLASSKSWTFFKQPKPRNCGALRDAPRGRPAYRSAVKWVSQMVWPTGDTIGASKKPQKTSLSGQSGGISFACASTLACVQAVQCNPHLVHAPHICSQPSLAYLRNELFDSQKRSPRTLAPCPNIKGCCPC